jgi:hypothetical protein
MKIKTLSLFVLLLVGLLIFSAYQNSLQITKTSEKEVRIFSSSPPYESWRATENFTREIIPEGKGSLCLNVPAYTWYRGCSPTAIAMLLGWYDLISGTDFIYTNNPYESIANSAYDNDYGSPCDRWYCGCYSYDCIFNENYILTDKSESPPGVAHESNCIADFLHTGWSFYDCAYGESGYFTQDILNYIYSRGCKVDSITNIFYNEGISYAWIKNEILQGRPVILTVDAGPWWGADGLPDHTVVAVGYNDNGNKIAVYNTWGTSYYWIDVKPCAPGNWFGIDSAIQIINPHVGVTSIFTYYSVGSTLYVDASKSHYANTYSWRFTINGEWTTPSTSPLANYNFPSSNWVAVSLKTYGNGETSTVGKNINIQQAAIHIENPPESARDDAEIPYVEHSTQTLLWSSIGNIPVVTIEQWLLDSNKNPIYLQSSQTTTNDGSQTWLFDSVGSYKMKIYQGSYISWSKVIRVIEPVEILEVTSPSEGDILSPDGTYTIEWSLETEDPDPEITQLRIVLCYPEEQYTQLIATDVSAAAGSFLWDVDVPFEIDNAFIIITDLNGFGASDWSNRFSIEYPNTEIRVTKPNGGEELEVGQSPWINWQLMRGLISHIKIELYQYGVFKKILCPDTAAEPLGWVFP